MERRLRSGGPKAVHLASAVMPRATEAQLEQMLAQAESDLEQAVAALERIGRGRLTEEDMRRTARSALRAMEHQGMS